MYFFTDAHSCLPLRGNTDINQLALHYQAGVRYVSINVGMDMNPIQQILPTIAGFRRQLKQHPDFVLVNRYEEILSAIKANKLAVSFDLEGSLPLLENPDMVEIYYQLGVRQIHLAYNRNNSVAGGAHDTPQGLSALGREIVDAIHYHGILMDLSHSSEQTAHEIIDYAPTRPVLYSHANPQAIVAHGRNISDAIIRKVAQTGGVIGLNGVARFMGDEALRPASLIAHIEHVINLVGEHHAAIGLDYCYDDGHSDFPYGVDRQYWWPPAAGYHPDSGLGGKYLAPSALPEIATLLSTRGHSHDTISKVMCYNLLNLIEKVWK